MSLNDHLKKGERILWHGDIKFVPDRIPYDDLWISGELMLTDRRLLWTSGSEIPYHLIKGVAVERLETSGFVEGWQGPMLGPKMLLTIISRQGNEQFEFPNESILKQAEAIIRKFLTRL